MVINIGPPEQSLIYSLSNDIAEALDKSGLFYRVFFRLKSNQSIMRKLEEKREKYKNGSAKMQDVFGVRITLYFKDDQDLAINIIKRLYQELPDDHSIDTNNDERFGPTRCNMIFRLPNSAIESSKIFTDTSIDTTFEVQFRTIFSEGWHEVEHDLRYKCREEWDDQHILSRQLNGQYAVLESCDWTILKIFDELAYSKYKNKEWSSLFRNVIRIRFVNKYFSQDVNDYLSKNPKISKEFLKADRVKLLETISSLTTALPLTMDLVLHVLNRTMLKKVDLINFEDKIIKEVLDNSGLRIN